LAAPIVPINGIQVPDIPQRMGTSGPAGAFRDVLAGAIQSVESTGEAASASVGRFLSGEGEELHSTIMATQRAELSFDLFLQVRNKVVGAYQEIMRMQM
jgi:flagellar hook-basal body complex protein FliE